MVFRKPQTLKNKLDALEKRLGKDNITIETHPACYQYDHYEFHEGNWENRFVDSIVIYYQDFDINKTIRSIEITAEDMRHPTKADYLYGSGKDLLNITWDKRWPTIIDIVEYDPYRG